LTTEDLDLYLDIREKDSRKSFDLLFHKHYVQLCRYAMVMIQDEAIAEEVVQETFINIWENRKNLQIEKSVTAYLFTAVRHRTINYLYKIKTRIKHETIYASELEFEGNLTKEEDLRLKAIVNEAIRLLPEKCKEIFCLARFEGLTYEEIAEYLKISKKTVENQMTIAFQKIREYLNHQLKNTPDKNRILRMLLL
jgi:RNA polymerase sigma-70 factor, ECF subfamily